MSGLSAVRGLNDVGAAQIAELLEVALTRQTAALEAVMEAKLAALETRIGSRLAALEDKVGAAALAPHAPMTDAPHHAYCHAAPAPYHPTRRTHGAASCAVPDASRRDHNQQSSSTHPCMVQTAGGGTPCTHTHTHIDCQRCASC